eukprot:GHVT01079843.1.p1 GENE.GHVT01079843.1~~GHVT01079843.1.p1  ORF type:complete len:577 (+),score=59.37 GHVT01079843.1:218-1948(+)
MNFKVALALFLLPLVTEGGARRCRLARAQEEIPAHAASAGGQVHADLPQAGHVETYNDIPAFKTLADMNRPTVTFRTDFSRFRMPAATKRSKTRSKPTKPKKASGKKLKIIAAMGLVVTTLAAISTVGLGLYFTNKSEADCPEKSQETQEKTPSSSADSSSVPSLKSTKPGLKDRGQPAPRKARPKHKPATVTDRSGEAGAAHSDDEAELEEPKPQGSPLQTREQTPSPPQKRYRLASPRRSNSEKSRPNGTQLPSKNEQETHPQPGQPGGAGSSMEISEGKESPSESNGGIRFQPSNQQRAGSSLESLQERPDESKDLKAYKQPRRPEGTSSPTKTASVRKSQSMAFSGPGNYSDEESRFFSEDYPYYQPVQQVGGFYSTNSPQRQSASAAVSPRYSESQNFELAAPPRESSSPKFPQASDYSPSPQASRFRTPSSKSSKSGAQKKRGQEYLQGLDGQTLNCGNTTGKWRVNGSCLIADAFPVGISRDQAKVYTNKLIGRANDKIGESGEPSGKTTNIYLQTGLECMDKFVMNSIKNVINTTDKDIWIERFRHADLFSTQDCEVLKDENSMSLFL